jgi:hypothetical protein
MWLLQFPVPCLHNLLLRTLTSVTRSRSCCQPENYKAHVLATSHPCKEHVLRLRFRSLFSLEHCKAFTEAANWRLAHILVSIVAYILADYLILQSFLDPHRKEEQLEPPRPGIGKRSPLLDTFHAVLKRATVVYGKLDHNHYWNIINVILETKSWK